ncbi:hypothetical protein ABH922_004529 [Rhodococcus sp. 27YEA15]|uniref:PucR family transcriptional regulator n=1 Tax=Rhodococcus sp. 27YEA15 TaxID=3156259 RepID=UPI003C7D647E
MATIGDLIDRVGLRSLTPGAVERARDRQLSAFCRIDPTVQITVAPGSLIYLPAAVWSAFSNVDAVFGEVRSGVGAVVDNDDCNLPPEFVTECVRESLPVFLLPKSIPFEDLPARLRTVSGGLDRDSSVDAIADVIDSFTRGTDVRVWVVTEGCVLTGSTSTTTDLPFKILSRTQVPVEKISSESAGVHTRLAGSGHALVLTNPNRRPWDLRWVGDLAHRIDTVMQALAVTRAARQLAESTLIRELVEAKVTSAGLDPWVRSLGLEQGSRIRAVSVVVPESSSCRVDTVVAGLQDLALRGGGTSVCGAHGGNAYALVTMNGDSGSENGDGSNTFDRHLGVLKSLFVERHHCTLTVGTSSCVLGSSDDLVRGLISARQMADRHIRSVDLDSHSIPLPEPLVATLLANEPRLVDVLYRALLEPVVDYDEKKGSCYLATMRTFLALDGQWGATASELGIHINTLRYRLVRIERLTGRGLHTSADRADFYTALALHESARNRHRDALRPPGLGESG